LGPSSTNLDVGKTTAARLYAKMLFGLGVIKSPAVVEMSGTWLADLNVQSLIENDLPQSGVLIVNDAYQLVASYNHAGRKALDILLDHMENSFDRFAVVFTGYKDSHAPLLGYNEGLISRIPYVLDFEDYTEDQLHTILLQLFDDQYNGRAQFEGGPNGMYMRAAVRRLCLRRGLQGFGNVRSLENLQSTMRERQIQRLRQMASPSLEDRLFFTKEDIFGPPPSDVREKCAALKQLRSLIGLEHVKASVEDMFDMIEENYHREVAGKRPMQFSLNRVFVGAPGTGKTTVAKLYGRILADLGLLSNGDGMYRTSPL
jgi:hypothetical protein